MHSWIPHVLFGDSYNDWGMEVRMTLCCFITCDFQCKSRASQSSNTCTLQSTSLCCQWLTHLMACNNGSSVIVCNSGVKSWPCLNHCKNSKGFTGPIFYSVAQGGIWIQCYQSWNKMQTINMWRIYSRGKGLVLRNHFQAKVQALGYMIF